MGPVENPTLFARSFSFRLEVPEAATLVTFTLEADADVALLVRHGQDNGVQDGRAVFDYADDERIGITRRSDPPLRAGTYFVSIIVIETGAVAEGTITATVDTDAADCHLDVTCHSEWASSATGVARIFIETSEGRTRACSGTVLNNRRPDFTPFFLTAAHCVQTEEEARSVTAAWLYQTRTCNGEPPDLRSAPRTEGARLLATTGFSDIEDVGQPEGDMSLLRLEGDLPDGVMFQGWDADPQPVGAQVAGIHHPASDWGEFKRISFGKTIPDPGFGVADESYLIVSYPLGQGYTEGGSSGSAIFGSPGTLVGALSGGEGGDFCPIGPSRDIYTRLSFFYPQIRQFIDEDFALEFAHFANGSSISSDVVLLNVAATPIRPTLYFADQEGNRIDAESLVEITRGLEVLDDGALSVRTEMAPLAELTISTHGRGDLVVGSARVIADGPIGGVLRFDAPGIGVVGVGASESLSDALFPARRQAGGINTGMALRNLEAEEMTVSCHLMRRGSVLEDAEIPLDAGGQNARFIHDIFPGVNTSDFVGSVRCTAPDGERVAGIALEMDPDNGIFTTLPLVPLDQAGAGNGETTLEFAHFANGSSITSDVVLLNVAATPIRPALYFFGQDGHEIAADSVVETGNSLEVRADGGLRVRQELPPLGELTISTHGRGDTVVGSVRVISDGPVGGVLRFSLPGSGVAGVGAGEPVADALFPARRQAGGINTGVALRNLNADEMTVSCHLMRRGSVLEHVGIPLEAGGQTARFIHQIFSGTDTSDFVGSVRCLAPDGGRFTGVALEMDFNNGIFTTLPVVPVKGGIPPEAPQMRPTAIAVRSD
ncbi:MAG: trypsin-like serine protease [Candidatus Aminicenantes bacterium]|nr:trypsin-like serine protease [Candidatus Aminicenantes bacterium]